MCERPCVVRIVDAERGACVNKLTSALVELQLDEAEFKERSSAALRAKGRGDTSAMPIDQLTRLGTVRTIVRWGDPILHRPARPVTDCGDELQSVLCDMFATNTAALGAGLAAPQIGIDLAAFVYDCIDADLRRHVGVFCNPVVELAEGRDRHLATWEEGCLSLPGGYAELARPDLAICRGQDQYGDPIELAGTGQLARCFQHETDHLNGMVFGDRLSSRRRRGLYESHRRVADRYPSDWPVTSDVQS